MSTQATINLTSEQQARIKELHNPERETVNEFTTRLINVGLSTLEYRKDSYPKTRDRNKLARRALKVVEADPELAARAGIAHKSNGSTGFQRVNS